MEAFRIICCIIFYIIEILLSAYLILKIIRHHKLSIKDTIAYPIVVLVTIITLIFSKYLFIIYKDNTTFLKVLVDSFKDGIKIVALVIDTDLVKDLFHDPRISSGFLVVSYCWAYALSALALFSISISLINVFFWSVFRRTVSFISFKTNKEVNYILGFNEEAKEYIKNYSVKYLNYNKNLKERFELFKKNFKERNHRLVVVLDSSSMSKFEDEKFFLHRYKVPFRAIPYSTKSDFSKLIWRLSNGFRNKKIITFFDDDKKNYLFSSVAANKVNKYKKTEYIMVVNSDQEKFLNGFLFEENKDKFSTDKSKGKIKIINRHNLISFNFIKKHNFAKYFPMEYLNDDLTIKKKEESDNETICDINLFFLGFGNVNQAICRDALITNQFVRRENNKLKPYRINVEIFETKFKVECLDLFSGLLKYKKSNYENSDEYFELPEDYDSYVHINQNKSLYEKEFIGELFKMISDKAKIKKQVNYFIVSLESDLINYNATKQIKANIDEINDTNNYYFVRTKDNIYDFDNSIIPFGKSADIYSYDNIVGNHIYETSNLFQCYYNNKTKEEIANITPIESKSNIYNVSSLYFKLSLLLLKDNPKLLEELKNNKENEVTNYLKKCFKKYIIPDNNDDNYIKDNHCYSRAKDINSSFYDSLTKGTTGNFSIRDVFSFIEHERWNAYELSIGVLPMKKEYYSINLKDTFNLIENEMINNNNYSIRLKNSLDKYAENGKIELSISPRYKINIKKNTNDYSYNINHIFKLNKSIDELYHLCITTNNGLKKYYLELSNVLNNAEEKYQSILDEVNEKIKQMLIEIGREDLAKEIKYTKPISIKSDVDVVQYDYKYMDIVYNDLLKTSDLEMKEIYKELFKFLREK